MKALDNSIGQINTRYCGILDQVKKAMLACEYLCALTSNLQHKVIGNKVVNQIILKSIGDWLLKVAAVKPKYQDLVVMENSHYILDTI